MKKIKKGQFHVTLTEETIEILNKFCDEKLINASKLVDWILIQYLNKEGRQ